VQIYSERGKRKRLDVLLPGERRKKKNRSRAPILATGKKLTAWFRQMKRTKREGTAELKGNGNSAKRRKKREKPNFLTSTPPKKG